MSDDERDPFEELDPGDDREGDPFERLGEGPDSEEAPETETDADTSEPPEAPPFGDDAADLTESHQSADDGWSGSESRDTSASETPETDPAGDGADDLLSAVDTEEFRSDSVTETDDAGLGSSTDPEDPFSGMDGPGEDPFGSGESAFERVDVDHIDADKVWAEIAEDGDSEDLSESRYAEVSKHRYCEQCEHFSEPPNARCTNDGTEIMEFLDMETVRLLNCPVVAEQHEIEREQ
ncbi:hypothetical protein Harman_06200 [Haloarcula mannanilytica]|uniref:DUF8135 domain-containing protein n=1 Tax=Haloarcula mannanilytica TaxID=2509225 RepID=A0A4C2EDV6_9EURY|nr:hypothetical protein [Haloarcula mannanilytica]GCF12685.1 hypothetical protein Harman_06200 [Haloarcula mannanilytica]